MGSVNTPRALRGLFNRKLFFIGCYCSSKMATDRGYMRACDWFSFSVVLTSWGGSPCRIKQGREAKSSGSKEILVFDLKYPSAMADTDEQVAPIEDEEPEETPGYKAPAQKSLDEITKLDADDESLVKYKQTLLGGAAAVGAGEG